MSNMNKVRQLGLKTEFNDFLDISYSHYYYFDYKNHTHTGYCYECGDGLSDVEFLETEDDQVCEYCLVEQFFAYRERRHKSKLALIVGDAFFSAPSKARLKLIK